jgi:hypothetical protein
VKTAGSRENDGIIEGGRLADDYQSYLGSLKKNSRITQFLEPDKFFQRLLNKLCC